MLRNLIILGTFLAYLIPGISSPFILGLGYVWVDVFTPQRVGYGLINRIPYGLIFAILSILAYLVSKNKSRFRINIGTVTTIIWGIWITLTTIWAAVPTLAWGRWDSAIKTVLFSGFVPLLIQSPVQVEALLLTIIFSLSGQLLAVGVKTLLTGGGYGADLGIVNDNVGMGEGSTLADVAIALIPIMLYMKRHSILLPKSVWVRRGWDGLMAVSILASMGTYERTGLVALAVLLFFLFFNVKRKLVFVIVVVIAATIGGKLVSDRWVTRMSTIETYASESSAATRIGVWLWTLDYVKEHPFGGGFGVDSLNQFTIDLGEGSFSYSNRAFHSIYFEVLGEQGIVGFIIFAVLILVLFVNLRSIIRQAKQDPDLHPIDDLARAIRVSAIVYFAGAAFVGIAFQPLHYYFFACAIAMRQYLKSRGTRPSQLDHLKRRAPLPISQRQAHDEVSARR